MAVHSHRDSPLVRTAARAVILRGEDLLVVRIRTEEGEFMVLPGGGQNHGETLMQTVVREVREELGLTITVTGLAYVREYVGKNHAMHRMHGHFHQVETVFHCQCQDFSVLGTGREQDRRQVGFLWLPLHKLPEYPLSPPGLREIIKNSKESGLVVYLGDVH